MNKDLWVHKPLLAFSGCTKLEQLSTSEQSATNWLEGAQLEGGGGGGREGIV